MNKIVSVAFVFLLSAFLVCCNGKGEKNNEPYDGGHGIGIDTATIHQIDMMEDSVDGRRHLHHQMANASMGHHLHHLMRRVDLPMSLTICVASILPLRMIWMITA